jgi:hypothetical protein
MRTFGSVPKLVAFSALLGLSATLSVAASQNGKAVVTSIKGTAQVGDQPAKVRQKIEAGSVVSTGPESRMDLFLGVNGPSVRVEADSRLSIDELTYDNEGVETVISTKLGVKAGQIAGYVKKTSDQSRYVVETATTTAAIRGTTYRVSSDGTVYVYEGCVNVVFKGIQYTVCAGQKFNPNAPGVEPLGPGDPLSPNIGPGPAAPPAPVGPIINISPISPGTATPVTPGGED